jgi:hypothetical protein
MARNFGTGEGLGTQEYFVYFKFSSRAAGTKVPASGDKEF